MTAWHRAARLDDAAFAEHFLGRDRGDPAAGKLRDVVRAIDLAQSHADLRQASERLAEAMQMVGFDRWPRFLADAAARARDPAAIAAAERSRQLPDPRNDAIRPVYPLETLLDIGTVSVVGGAAAVSRAAGSAMLRQICKARTRSGGVAAEAGNDTATATNKDVSRGRKPRAMTMTSRHFPGNPDDLLIPS